MKNIEFSVLASAVACLKICYLEKNSVFENFNLSKLNPDSEVTSSSRFILSRVSPSILTITYNYSTNNKNKVNLKLVL